MKTLTAVLFVGGESRRMGRDKAALILNGEPLWSRQIQVLRELHPEKVMISARKKPDWCPADVDVALDEPPSRGPLSGLVACLEKIQTTHLLILAVDMAKMTVEHIHKLWAMAEPGIGVFPHNEETFEPLCAIYPVESASLARCALSRDLSLGGIVRALIAQKRGRFYPVTNSDASIYQSFNTPEQWEHAFA